MKKYLPQFFNNPSGFTLIELLIVITITAILAAIGFALFSGLTGRGNDDRRASDLKAYADAMEVRKDNSGFYLTVAATDFAGGVFPFEPTTRQEKYCYRDGTAAIANPAVSAWPASACPSLFTSLSGVSGVSGAAPLVSATATFFKFCTVNEAKTAVICYGSRQ